MLKQYARNLAKPRRILPQRGVLDLNRVHTLRIDLPVHEPFQIAVSKFGDGVRHNRPELFLLSFHPDQVFHRSAGALQFLMRSALIFMIEQDDQVE